MKNHFNTRGAKTARFRNDPKAVVEFAVGDVIETDKDGVELQGTIVTVCGQQLTCEGQHGIFYAWSWQSRRVS